MRDVLDKLQVRLASSNEKQGEKIFAAEKVSRLQPSRNVWNRPAYATRRQRRDGSTLEFAKLSATRCAKRHPCCSGPVDGWPPIYRAHRLSSSSLDGAAFSGNLSAFEGLLVSEQVSCCEGLALPEPRCRRRLVHAALVCPLVISCPTRRVGFASGTLLDQAVRVRICMCNPVPVGGRGTFHPHGVASLQAP